MMNRSNHRLLLRFLAATLLYFMGCRHSQKNQPATEYPLPPIADVKAVVAHYFDNDTENDIHFNVPLDQLPLIYAALEPAAVEPEPAKWIGLGEMEMTLSDGGPFRVDFYLLDSKEPGAFSAGQTFEKRTYYRAASSQQLMDALRKAHGVASKTNAIDKPKGP